MVPRREHPLERLQRDFDTLFGRLWGGSLAPLDQDVEIMRLWDFDVKDADKEIVVRAELPGFEENELDVQINKDVLTIKGEKEKKSEQVEEYRNFYRSIALPAGTNPENARASYHNGVLELHIPKAADAQPRRIEIESQQGQQTATGKQGRQTMPNQPSTPSQAGKQDQKASNQAGAAAAEKAAK